MILSAACYHVVKYVIHTPEITASYFPVSTGDTGRLAESCRMQQNATGPGFESRWGSVGICKYL